MIRSLCKLQSKVVGKMAVNVLFRGLATESPARMEDYFKDKRFIVTGSCTGMGHKITERLLDLGAFVFAVVQKEEGAAPPTSSNMKQVFCDVSDWENTYKKMKDIGPVHGLVNNAGVAVIEPFFDVTEYGWDKTLNVNARAIVRISQAVAKNMIDAGIKGSIVNISSTISTRAIPDHTTYCASKGAVNQITRTMAIELGKFGIRTNNVNPTVVMTRMGKIAWSDPAKSTPILNRIPLGRFAETDDVANAVIFMLSNYSSMVNGTALVVDGGFLSG
ncbi:L-xylulose reductase-like [Daktulosphaira vitifoliae]|uniref:L-xylulose reductase-like n=1 Tax=Daktulosphaira vitifoliae TaxID=58002 RepID=UPI0021A97C04|nr:L-xylulose reductase-like [Daktulosphaira vitifoliae]